MPHSRIAVYIQHSTGRFETACQSYVYFNQWAAGHSISALPRLVGFLIHTASGCKRDKYQINQGVDATGPLAALIE